jgi:hypothetical protein
LKPPGSVGNPVRTGRDVDSPGRPDAFPVSDAVLEPDDNAGNKVVAVSLPESVAELAALSDVAESAVPDDAVGIASLPVLDRVGRAD